MKNATDIIQKTDYMKMFFGLSGRHKEAYRLVLTLVQE